LDVGYWHQADVQAHLLFGRFREQSGHLSGRLSSYKIAEPAALFKPPEIKAANKRSQVRDFFAKIF
jgi:hypothetical protein